MELWSDDRRERAQPSTSEEKASLLRGPCALCSHCHRRPATPTQPCSICAQLAMPMQLASYVLLIFSWVSSSQSFICALLARAGGPCAAGGEGGTAHGTRMLHGTRPQIDLWVHGDERRRAVVCGPHPAAPGHPQGRSSSSTVAESPHSSSQGILSTSTLHGKEGPKGKPWPPHRRRQMCCVARPQQRHT